MRRNGKSDCAKEASTERRTEERRLPENFDTCAPGSTGRNMKLLFVILCLIAIYGTCRISADLIDDIDNDGDITVASQTLEKSLSRQKRALGIAPITKLLPIGKSILEGPFGLLEKPPLGESLLGKCPLAQCAKPILDIGMSLLEKSSLGKTLIGNCPLAKGVKSILDIVTFAYDILTGQKECPKIESLPHDISKKFALQPIEIVKTILGYIFNKIGSQGRGILQKACSMFSTFARRTLLPGFHALLNKVDDTIPLPAEMVAGIKTFNAIYTVLKLSGYVG